MLSHCFLTSAWPFLNSQDGLLGFGFLNPAFMRHCIILCLQQYSMNAINVRITKKIESSITNDMLVFGLNAFSMSCSSVSSGLTVVSGLTKIVVLIKID
jgi:hypothetical protein